MILKAILHFSLEVFLFFFVSVFIWILGTLGRVTFKKKRAVRAAEFKLYLELSNSYGKDGLQREIEGKKAA
jgi:hypothetical protein